MPAILNADQSTFYATNGYLLPNQQLFDAATFTRLTETYNRLSQRWTDEFGFRAEDMDTPHFWAPELFEFLLHDNVLDVVESLIGPDIALMSSHFIAKPAGTGRRVPWHEDSAYWKTRVRPMEVVTVWLAIDPSIKENGCLRVIPGTHHNGYSEYTDVDNAVFSTEIARVDESTAVDFELQPGEYSLHHAKIIHGSEPNTSHLRRCGYTMRYFSTQCEFIDPSEDFRIYLARGQDHAGNDYAEPGTNEIWVRNKLSTVRM